MEQVSVLETNIGSSTTGNSANTQIIFNDNGTLRGDAGLVYNKTTDTLTAGNATITGAATVTGAANLNGAVNLSLAGTATVTLGATATYGVLVGSGTNAASIYINGATRPGNSAMLQFGAAEHQFLNSSLSTVWATLNSTGLNIANGNVILGTSGKGIDFSATSHPAGMTSELLNDYEEGTFTPVVIGTTFFNTATYSRQLGRYTKVGNLVTIQIYLAWSAGTGVGNLAFYGLPFNIANNANEYATATIGFFDSIALTALNIPTIIGPANDTMLQLWQFPVGGGVPSQVPYDAAGSIILTSTYVAA